MGRHTGCKGRVEQSTASVIDIPSQRMDSFERYFTMHRKLLSLAGLWHTQPRKERLLRYCVIGFISLYNLFGEVCQIVTLNLDLQSVVRSLQVFIPAVCGSVIYYTAIINYMTLRTVYTYVQQDWQRLKNDTELKIMQKHSYISKLFTQSFGLLVYVYVTITMLPPLQRIIMSTSEVRSDVDHYPILSCIDYFLDRRTYYYPLLMYQITTNLLLVAIVVTCYSMYFSFIQHACACLSIIKYKIYFPFINNDSNDNGSLVPTDLTHWIIDIIKHLSRTKKFMMLVNAITEKCYLVQVFLGFILLIIDFLSIFQIPSLLDHKGSNKDLIELISFIFGTLFVIHVNCYTGQLLLDRSTDVYREVCLIPIYKISSKTQKLLLTTLMISAKPCTFSIYKVYVFSHEFFSHLLQSSLSYAMVLRSMQKI